MWAPLALGCGGSGLESGLTNTCLYNDDTSVADTTQTLVELEGTVVSDEPFVDGGGWCSATATRALTIEGEDGSTYRLGYGFESADGTDLTPPMPMPSGQSVNLTYRQFSAFGTAAGFVLTSQGQLQAALEMGSWGSGLELGDVPGVTVSAGASLGTELSDCGLKTYYELRFDGDDDRRVEPVNEASIPVQGTQYSAYAIARYEWPDDTECTDISGQEMWAIWLNR